MQTLPRTSLKNNYPYQILINLASILTGAYNFMIKRIPQASTFLLEKMQDVMFLFLYHILGLHFLETIKQ